MPCREFCCGCSVYRNIPYSSVLHTPHYVSQLAAPQIGKLKHCNVTCYWLLGTKFVFLFGLQSHNMEVTRLGSCAQLSSILIKAQQPPPTHFILTDVFKQQEWNFLQDVFASKRNDILPSSTEIRGQPPDLCIEARDLPFEGRGDRIPAHSAHFVDNTRRMASAVSKGYVLNAIFASGACKCLSFTYALKQFVQNLSARKGHT